MPEIIAIFNNFRHRISKKALLIDDQNNFNTKIKHRKITFAPELLHSLYGIGVLH